MDSEVLNKVLEKLKGKLLRRVMSIIVLFTMMVSHFVHPIAYAVGLIDSAISNIDSVASSEEDSTNVSEERKQR